MRSWKGGASSLLFSGKVSLWLLNLRKFFLHGVLCAEEQQYASISSFSFCFANILHLDLEIHLAAIEILVECEKCIKGIFLQHCQPYSLR
jgi:hypothetical protein